MYTTTVSSQAPLWPHRATSGIIALMLQANPNLSPTQVRNILSQTAILDTFTGALPQQGLNTWGHGKSMPIAL
jgi:subtilisin family serine protease